MSKYLNQLYFDDENSKRMHYVLGAFYANLSYDSAYGIIFRSNKRNLVELVQDELESNHSLIRDKRSNHHSYWIEIENAEYMRYRLQELGIVEDKSKRKFPSNMGKTYLSHFVRGFFDAKARVHGKNGKLPSIEITFNKEFLLGLNGILAKYPGVEQVAPTQDFITYKGGDVSKIYDFIYGDWEYVRKSGSYVPLQKHRFDTDYELPEPKDHPLRAISLKRIERAKKLLGEGYKPKEIAKKLNYLNLFAFYRAFKHAVGLTTMEYKKLL